MIELLVLKTGDEYISFTGKDKDKDIDKKYITCPVAKASVYPLEQLADIQEKRKILQRAGVERVTICKLTIVEELYEGDSGAIAS